MVIYHGQIDPYRIEITIIPASVDLPAKHIIHTGHCSLGLCRTRLVPHRQPVRGVAMICHVAIACSAALTTRRERGNALSGACGDGPHSNPERQRDAHRWLGFPGCLRCSLTASVGVGLVECLCMGEPTVILMMMRRNKCCADPLSTRAYDYSYRFIPAGSFGHPSMSEEFKRSIQLI